MISFLWTLIRLIFNVVMKGISILCMIHAYACMHSLLVCRNSFLFVCEMRQNKTYADLLSCVGTVFVEPESVDSSPVFQELETSRTKSKFKGENYVIKYIFECC